jgi:sigma-B regulation protein RsbU (phosphoserine phosphatase)
MVLGFAADCLYREQVGHMEVGDTLVFYTDGITDATDTQNRIFGEEHLQRVVAEHSGAPAAGIASAIDQARRDFIGSAPQFDDVTLVVVKRIGRSFDRS